MVCAVALPNRPAAQRPVQLLLTSPVVAPNVPAGHGVHTPAAPVLNWPAGHTEAVELVDPGGQAKPGEHAPLHKLVVAPGSPKRPAAHAPAHWSEDAPGTSPKRPALQFWQVLAPTPLNVPAGHCSGEPKGRGGTQKKSNCSRAETHTDETTKGAHA